MFTKVKTLAGYTLHARDGEVGKVKEFYFDDQHWTVRYLVVDTGNWISGRQVLISPYVITAVNKIEETFMVSLTKQQIENSPALNTDKPVSRQFEELYNGYYRLPMYWNGPYVWGEYPYLDRDHKKTQAVNPGGKTWDPNLRSTSAVTGYNVEASDGDIGHIDDFVIDDETWTIRYVVVDTVNWWPGTKVLIASRWIERVSWDKSKVFVNLTRDAIKKSPEYTEKSLLTREYETALHRHYNRMGYWDDEQGFREHNTL